MVIDPLDIETPCPTFSDEHITIPFLRDNNRFAEDPSGMIPTRIPMR